jgi:hypothetical protein
MPCLAMCAYVNFAADSQHQDEARCSCGAVWQGKPGHRELCPEHQGRPYEFEIRRQVFPWEMIIKLTPRNRERFFDHLVEYAPKMGRA